MFSKSKNTIAEAISARMNISGQLLRIVIALGDDKIIHERVFGYDHLSLLEEHFKRSYIPDKLRGLVVSESSWADRANQDFYRGWINWSNTNKHSNNPKKEFAFYVTRDRCPDTLDWPKQLERFKGEIRGVINDDKDRLAYVKSKSPLSKLK